MPGPVNTNLVPGPVNTNLGPGPGPRAKQRAGGREIQIPFQKQSSSEVYFSSYQRNIVSKQTFSLVSDIDVEKTRFLM